MKSIGNEMDGASIGNTRRHFNASRALYRLSNNIGMAFSAAVQDDCRQAVARTFGDPNVDLSGVTKGHIANTLQRARELSEIGKPILIAQDTTGLNYTTQKQKEGIGPIGSKGSGYLSHSALMLSPRGLPLGVVSNTIWSRSTTELSSVFFANSSVKNMAENLLCPEAKESLRWTDTVQNVQSILPADLSFLFIQDREADIFEFLAQPRRESVHLLVRAAQPRTVIVEINGVKSTQSTLLVAARGAEVLGTLKIDVPRKADSAARVAELSVRVCQCKVQPPRYWSAAKKVEYGEILISVISVREENPPVGKDPIDWTLLSTTPIMTFEEAVQVVKYYTYRWRIERLHYGLKSGLHIEDLQFMEFQTMCNIIGLYYITAWYVMLLAYIAREEGESAAVNWLDEDQLTILELSEGKPITTVKEAVTAVAVLGGYTSYKNSPPPGLKVIWDGLRALHQRMVVFELLRDNPDRLKRT